MSKAAVVSAFAATGVLLSLSDAPKIEDLTPSPVAYQEVPKQTLRNVAVLEATQYEKVLKQRPMLLGKCVDLNQASKSALMDLPRIGPKLAERIIHYRSHQRRFKRVSDLKRVNGIGVATLATIKPYVCIKK